VWGGPTGRTGPWGGLGALRRIDRLLAKTAESKMQNEGRSWHLTLGSGSSGGRSSDMTLSTEALTGAVADRIRTELPAVNYRYARRLRKRRKRWPVNCKLQVRRGI
jgi:hypothetical protein